MIRTQVYLPEDIYTQLKLIAANSKFNFSELIRQGAQKVISDQKPKTLNKKVWFENFIGTGITNIKTSAVKDIADYYRYWWSVWP